MDVAPTSRQPPPGPTPHRLLASADWTFCRMEHTRIGPVRLVDQAAPFHHLALPLGPARPRLGLRVAGRWLRPGYAADEILAIEAGSDGHVWWDDPFESACFYFPPEAIGAALGRPVAEHDHHLRTTAGMKAPITVHLLKALHADAEAGQPHGRMVGDAIFSALAAQFVAPDLSEGPSKADWRGRPAPDYIHAHLTEPMDLATIAAASGTSPFHLGRSFRTAVGVTIWRYVLQQRARRAETLIRTGDLSLTEVAWASGFETYPSFVSAMRKEFSTTPNALRRAMRMSAVE